MDSVCSRFIGEIEKTFVWKQLWIHHSSIHLSWGPGVPAIHYMKINGKISEAQSSSSDQFHIQAATVTFLPSLQVLTILSLLPLVALVCL